MSKRETPYALCDIDTNEIHYFDYMIDYKEAKSFITEDGRLRFREVKGSFIQPLNPKGEPVFNKSNNFSKPNGMDAEKVKKGRPVKVKDVGAAKEVVEGIVEGEIQGDTEDQIDIQE